MNNTYYQVTNPSEGVYRITSAEAVYEDLFVGTQYALLFDTGWGMGPLYETVRQITDKPLIVVNSHGHVDHVCGNHQFKGEILIHSNDIELAKMHGGSTMRSFVTMKAPNGMGWDGFCREEYVKEPDVTYVPIAEGHVFDLGGIRLEVVELPGHTTGSIGLLCRQKQSVWAGDAINGCLLLNGPEAAPLERYIATLKKALGIDFEKMYISHQGQPLSRDDISGYLTLACRVDWDRAIPYRDPNDPNSVPSDTVRVMCTDGMTLDDLNKPGFACIIFTKEKLSHV